MSTKQNWIVTFGDAHIDGSVITHITKRKKPIVEQTTAEGEGKVFPPHTILRSSVEFEQGTISGQIYLGSVKDCCVLLVPADPAIPQGGGTATDLLTG